MNGYEQMPGQAPQNWGQGGYQPRFGGPVQVERQDPRASQYNQPQFGQPYGGQQMNFQPSYFMQSPTYQSNQYGSNRGQDNQTLVKVLSEAEAQSYLVARGNSVAMIDSAGRKLFIKSVDMDGSPSFERYALIPEHDPVPTNPEPVDVKSRGETDYVTRKEYDEMKKEHDKLMELMKKLAERVSGDGSETE